jgi:Transposase domain (DUF772)
LSTRWTWRRWASRAWCPRQPAGRPARPSSRTRLKICLYGHLNRAQSGRRLERETQRNLELRWLTGWLTPDFKTIADFRKDNGPAIRATCRQLVLLCRRLDLFSVGGAPQGAWEPWAGQAPQLLR